MTAVQLAQILHGPIESAPEGSSLLSSVYWIDDTGDFSVLYRPIKDGETPPDSVSTNGWIPVTDSLLAEDAPDGYELMKKAGTALGSAWTPPSLRYDIRKYYECDPTGTEECTENVNQAMIDASGNQIDEKAGPALGHVYAPGGIYQCAPVLRNHVKFRGDGPIATYIREPEGFDGEFIIDSPPIGDANGDLYGASIEDLYVWGRRQEASVAGGIRMYPNGYEGPSGPRTAWAKDLCIFDVGGDGMVMGAGPLDAHVSRIFIFWAGGNGFVTDTNSFDSYYDQISVGGTWGQYGILILSAGNQFTNSQSWYNNHQDEFGEWDGIGWGIFGYGTRGSVMVSEDNPVGFLLAGQLTSKSLASQGDRIGMKVNSLGSVTYGGRENDIHINLSANDRFLHEIGIQFDNYVRRGHYSIGVDRYVSDTALYKEYETVGEPLVYTASGSPGVADGTRPIGRPSFKTFVDNTTNPYPLLTNSNEFDVKGHKATRWVDASVVGPTFNIDELSGLNIHVTLNANLTFSFANHLHSIPPGAELWIWVSADATQRTITWDPIYFNAAGIPRTPAPNQSVLFIFKNQQFQAGFTSPYWRYMPHQYHAGEVVASFEGDAGPSNTITETDLFSLPTYVPLVVGDVIKVTALGKILDDTGSNLTIQVRFKIGATTVDATVANVIGTSTNERAWIFDGEIHITATGVQWSRGMFYLGNAASANVWQNANNYVMPMVETSTEDLSTAKNVKLTAQLGTASASAYMKCKSAKLILLPKK